MDWLDLLIRSLDFYILYFSLTDAFNVKNFPLHTISLKPQFFFFYFNLVQIVCVFCISLETNFMTFEIDKYIAFSFIIFGNFPGIYLTFNF